MPHAAYPIAWYIGDDFKSLINRAFEAFNQLEDDMWCVVFDIESPGFPQSLYWPMRKLYDIAKARNTDEYKKLIYDFVSRGFDLKERILLVCNNYHKNTKPVDPTDFWPEILTEEGKAHYHYDKMKLDRDDLINYIKYGETPKEETMVNFRKNLEYLRRDKKHSNEFNIKFKNRSVIRKIEFQGATKKELYSDELVEDVLIIASQMNSDRVAKVIFNLKNKMTIIFPWKYGLPDKVVVKANGADTFDILNGYSIAKAKMMCSEDGYEWLNKLKKSGKVDV